MNNPAISVCIPTYNRADCLRQCLESIFFQISNTDLNGQVEVVVSNNASTDHTQSVLESFKSGYANLKVLKNESNLGFDKNVLNCVAAASGDFCWLLGDDDALFETALKHALSKIKTGKWDYLMANCWGFDTELKNKALNKPNLPIQSDHEFKSLSEFVLQIKNLEDVVGYFGGMSGQIFKKQVWDNFAEKEKFIGTQAIHLFVLLGAFKNLPFLEIAEPLVKVRASNMRWETFPGLENFFGRAKKTQSTLLWIVQTYSLNYSKTALNVFFYLKLGRDSLKLLVKKVFFTSPFMRRKVLPLVKKAVGK